MIMVKDLSRLGRNHIEVNKYIEENLILHNFNKKSLIITKN